MATINFTELFATITSATTGSWATIDLTSLGVPNNAVVVVLAEHKTDGTPALCGVRKVGSSLARYLNLHEPEGGGSTSTVMHVQSDATASIQYYKGDSATVFTLLGYYGSGITYTEEMIGYELSGATGWTQTGFGQNDTVFEVVCLNEEAGNTAVNMGCREFGSSLARYYDIHEAEPSGINSYTSYVQSNASGDVQLYRENLTFVPFYYVVGYFSSNIQLEEAFDDCTPTSDATWRTNVAINTGGEDCVGLIACMHQSNGSGENTGARGGASAVARYWLEHESETDQYTGDTLPVLVDSSGYYDTYFGDVSDALFYCLGYLYDTGGAPAAVAPTSVLYGPLCGPFAGPI